MLKVWLSVAQVAISGYQPIAEQTWVQLNPKYYPLDRTPPAMFVAWHGNQYPPLAKKQKRDRWQILFPVRLEPPFDLFEGEAQLSKTYLARLKRIDELAYGVDGRQPEVRDSSRNPAGAAQSISPAEVSKTGGDAPIVAVDKRKQEHADPLKTRPEIAVPTYQSTASTGRQVCHQVAAGETLWRIASRLSQDRGGDVYSFLLALVQENPTGKMRSFQVNAGDHLYCPRSETLARFDALSRTQRKQLFVRMSQKK